MNADRADPDAWMARAFVDVADAMTGSRSGRDVMQILVDRSAEVVAGDLGAVACPAPGGGVSGTVASTGACGVIEALVGAADGPTVDCLASGFAVFADDVDDAGGRWPDFGAVASAVGARSAYAAPMRRHHVMGGVLLVVADRPFGLDGRSRAGFQALADVAAIVARPVDARTGAAIESALDDRTAIEQAVGMLSEQGGVTPLIARWSLRRCATAHAHDIARLARGVIDGDFDFADVTAAGSTVDAL